ncbi:polysaccharide biosynthesis tyrosine autokinase [Glaciibacter sp. 2TAF33]|uniref:polysaccharide biosynthesis tyrosine autokinase n=1 Tax=Glaciibacter sp. 2TAF33 TaxID=3233015 RepID=UPI003F8E0641
MEPIDYARAIGRRWVAIMLLALLCTGAASLYLTLQAPLYKSTASVFVSNQSGDTTNELVQGATFTQNLVQSYAQLATTPAVLKPVITSLNLDTTSADLAKSVSASTALNTVIIDITVVDPSPVQAARIADAITASLSTTVRALAPKGPNSTSTVTMSTVSNAAVPKSPFSPNPQLTLGAGLIAGLALGVIYALARELLDTRVHGERDLLRVSDVPVLGKTARRRRRGVGGLVMRSDPHSPRAEEYRRIRANLEFIDVDRRPRTIVITSPLPNDGKSTTAMNLAFALAENSSSVLLIDADLRRPSIAEMCGLEGAVGLTTVLVGAVDPDDAITALSDSLHVLPSGITPPNPGQLLGSKAMKDLIAKLASAYEYIVIDSPPLLPASDTLGLAHVTDGTLVVVRYKSTRRAQLANTLDALNAVNARVLGIVLNQTPEGRESAYYTAAPVQAASHVNEARTAKRGVSASRPARPLQTTVADPVTEKPRIGA